MGWVPRSAVEAKSDASEYLFEKEEEFLDSDPVIHYAHSELTQIGTGNTMARSAYNAMHLVSVWDLQVKDFRVKIVQCDNLPPDPSSKGSLVFLKVGIYDGTELLSQEQITMQMPYESQVRWNTYATTALKLADLPRNTKLCFTLYRLKDKKKPEGAVPIGWVSCMVRPLSCSPYSPLLIPPQLYNYKHELRTGKLALKMWPNGEALPEHTVVTVPPHLPPPLLTPIELHG